LIIPFIFILFSLNPSIRMAPILFIPTFVIMFIPSIISLILSKKIYTNDLSIKS
jgi:hypothetical protein